MRNANNMPSADEIVKDILVKLNIMEADSKTPKEKPSIHIPEGKASVQDMITGIRRDLNGGKASADYYDFSIEFSNNTRKLTGYEDEIFYKIAAIMLLETELFNINLYPDFDAFMAYWERKKGAHILSCTITASLFRNEKFRGRKYRKLLELLDIVNRMT